MTGSIQEKHGKLYAVLCYKDVLGKSQRKWVPTNLEVRGNKKRAESMLPDMRFHDIRHSTASILYDKGWELKVIQQWLGHTIVLPKSPLHASCILVRKKLEKRLCLTGTRGHLVNMSKITRKKVRKKSKHSSFLSISTSIRIIYIIIEVTVIPINIRVTRITVNDTMKGSFFCVNV